MAIFDGQLVFMLAILLGLACLVWLRGGEALVLRPDATLVDVNRTRLAPTSDTVATAATGLAALGTRFLLFVALLLALFESWSFHRRLTV